MQLVGNNEEWHSTLRDQFMYHALYLNSRAFNINNYSPILDDLIKEAIYCYELSQPENDDISMVVAGDIKKRNAKQCDD